MTKSIDRNIKFFRLNLGIFDNKPIELDREKLCKRLSDLAKDNKELPVDDDISHKCEYTSLSEPFRMRFLKIKTTDLPKIVDKERETKDIEEGNGIGDFVHAVLFENNIIGVESNKNGTSMEFINRYFISKAPDLCDNIKYEHLVRPEIMEKIKRGGTILQFEVELNPSFQSQEKSITDPRSGIFTALTDLKNFGNDANFVTISIKAQDYRSKKNAKGLDRNETLKNIKILSNMEGVSGLYIKQIQGNGEREKINILNSFMIIKKKVVKLDRSKSIDSADMWEKIQEAYEENREDIKRSERMRWT
jgi:hypothetical protein